MQVSWETGCIAAKGKTLEPAKPRLLPPLWAVHLEGQQFLLMPAQS